MGILIGMIFEGELVVGSLDLGGICILRNPGNQIQLKEVKCNATGIWD
jgi:hypothetical protein